MSTLNFQKIEIKREIKQASAVDQHRILTRYQRRVSQQQPAEWNSDFVIFWEKFATV